MLLVWRPTFEHPKSGGLEVSVFSREYSNNKHSQLCRLHVFADLQPYICTFTGCEDELLQFSSRAAWADHEFSKHRIDQFWDCPECSNKYSSAVDWEKHLLTFHKRAFSRPKLQIAKHMAYKPQSRPIESEECPFCRNLLVKTRRAFVKHVGRHMEEIALMTLPRGNPEGSDGDSVSTGQEPSLRSNQPLSPVPVLGPKIEGHMETDHHQSSPLTEARPPRSTRKLSKRALSSKSSHGKENSMWLCHNCNQVNTHALCPVTCGTCPHHRCSSCSLL